MSILLDALSYSDRPAAPVHPAEATSLDRVMKRAVEHILSGDMPGTVDSWVAPVSDGMVRRAAPLLAPGVLTVFDWPDQNGSPILPSLAPWAAAQEQAAEKQEPPALHRSIAALTPHTTTVASTLNISKQLESLGAAGNSELVIAFLEAAADAGVDSWLASLLEAEGTAAATLDAGLDALEAAAWEPSIIAGPRAKLAKLELERLQLLGLRPVADGNLDHVLVLDPSAVLVALGGRLLEQRPDPFRVGREVAAGRIVTAGVAATGVAVIA